MTTTSVSAVPTQLGRYEVGGRVGGGGMANVYVGRGVRDDGTEELVALKVMRSEYGQDPRFLRMFSDEAQILRRLSHPNIIRTIEAGITREHRFIVMELLAGRALADVWQALVDRDEQVPFALGAWICARVAEGLHAAHELTDERGVPLAVIHRDVNPSNIFLTHDGDVKLIDFGLAKSRFRRTQSVDGIVKGKFPYLAPEQLKSQPPDRRVDLFALGTTLWELGTMRRLFKRDRDIDSLLAIREGHIPDAREVRPGYPEALFPILMRALAQDPDERYPTAVPMRADLDRFAGDDGLSGRDALARLVGRLFPGEHDTYSTWERGAMEVRVLATAPPPPMPVPVASSNLVGTAIEEVIDDAEIEVISPPK